MHVAFRAGQLNSIHRGSAGLAILAAAPARPGERDELASIRSNGYATSFSEVVPSVYGVSAAVPSRTAATMSVGVSTFDLRDEERVAAAVMAAAQRLGDELG
jgi:DNA-binding IclR family transcriptional regulator